MTRVIVINFLEPLKSLKKWLLLPWAKAMEFRSVQGPEMHFVYSCA